MVVCQEFFDIYLNSFLQFRFMGQIFLQILFYLFFFIFYYLFIFACIYVYVGACSSRYTHVWRCTKARGQFGTLFLSTHPSCFFKFIYFAS